MRRRRAASNKAAVTELGSSPSGGYTEEYKSPAQEIASPERYELGTENPPREMETQWQHLVHSELESPANKR